MSEYIEMPLSPEQRTIRQLGNRINILTKQLTNVDILKPHVFSMDVGLQRENKKLRTKLETETFTYDELLLIYDVLNTTKIKSCSNQNNVVTVEKLKEKVKNIGLKGAK